METPMKTLYLAAALLMASTAAHAGSGISFMVDGQKIHIDAPKNCSSLDCIKITGANGSNFNLKGFGSKKNDDDDVATAPAPAPVAPALAAPAAPAAAPVASMAPVAPAAPIAPAPQSEQLTATAPAPLPPTPPAPVAAAPAPAPVAAAPVATPAAAPVQIANSPLGVWATEENKGNVRVEACGANLCGYAVNSGERILINMKSEGSKWTGRIHDPDSGKDYDSTIAMKGSNILKVQGCAFGGMFCGGQTWKRVS
jgi:uncharacterized protein (DUF2147 family)